MLAGAEFLRGGGPGFRLARRLAYLAPVLLGLVCAAVLLAARLAPTLSPASYFEFELILLIFAAFLAVPAAALLTFAAALLVLRGHRGAILPLLAGAVAVVVPFLPLSPLVQDLDDRLHAPGREAVVRRIEADELQVLGGYYDPSGQRRRGQGLAGLPPEYPQALSWCGGHRLVSVEEEEPLVVAFCPHPGLFNVGGWIVYSAAGPMPDHVRARLTRWGWQHAEPLRAHWYRLR
jgi:hypothetical protein